MRAMGCLRIAFADREITLDDFNRGVSLRALWSSGEHLWHPFCSTRLDSAIHAKAAAQRTRLDRACHDLNRLLDEPGP